MTINCSKIKGKRVQFLFLRSYFHQKLSQRYNE